MLVLAAFFPAAKYDASKPLNNRTSKEIIHVINSQAIEWGDLFRFTQEDLSKLVDQDALKHFLVERFDGAKAVVLD